MLRHSREGGDPSPTLSVSKTLLSKLGTPVLDSRLRGNDEVWC